MTEMKEKFHSGRQHGIHRPIPIKFPRLVALQHQLDKNFLLYVIRQDATTNSRLTSIDLINMIERDAFPLFFCCHNDQSE